MIKRVVDFVFANKLVAFLSVALFSFFVATIALAVEKTDVTTELTYCNTEKERLLSIISAASTVEASSTTVLPTASTTVPTVTSTLETTVETTTILPKIDYRLPSNVKPFEYNLYLHPTLGVEGFYTGKVIIGLNVTEGTNEIVLHSKDLNITTLTVWNRDTDQNVDRTFSFDYVLEFIRINVYNIPPGIYDLTIDFEGSLIDTLVGFYQSKYTNKDNEEKYIATSKFEPTFARQAFPCFDEPSMKATFSIQIVRPATDGYIALSNMDMINEEPNEEGTLTTVSFAKSVPMSTYLACFIVCDFIHKEDTIIASVGNNVTMRVFATPDQLDKVDFALETGVKVTEYYIKYFDIEYPLPKLDMIAIPDFVSGAMEHWGLVTFRETTLLFDEKISSTVNKQRVASVVAHELAHMWFGNLVTMAWWNDLWLNEGFASYIEYKGIDEVQKDWGMMEQFLIDDLHSVLNLDATLASHPIVQTVEHPDDITELFDAITYNKGAAVIRMLEDMVGTENFREGVTNYLNAHKYGNAVTMNLLDELEKLESEINIKQIMATWTEQMGLPIISVRKSGTAYILEQKRFFSNPKSYDAEHKPSEHNYLWSIKITYITNTDNTDKHIWLMQNDLTTELQVEEPHSWIKFNKDQIGYYRVNYPLDMWQSLTTALVEDYNVMSISDRAHLLNDAFSIAESTMIPYSIPLDLTKYLANENSYVPWAVASSKLSNINNLLYYTNIYSTFKKYTANLIKDIYNEVSWNVTSDETHLKKRLRITILDLACSMGITECLEEAGKEFTKWITSNDTSERPSPDIRSIVYYYGMVQNPNEELWNKMLQIFVDEQDASEKLKLMYGLSGIQLPYILSKFVQLANDSTYVREQDYFTCLQYIAANRIGESIVWEYVRENWEKLVDKFGLNERYLGRMIPSITSKFSTKTRLDEMLKFFEDYPEAGAGKAARVQAIENVENNIEWLKNNKELIEVWLANNPVN